MTVDVKPLNEINERAIDLLTRELGVADTLRFMMQFSSGEGNYTEEREVLFGALTLEEIVKELRESQKRRNV